jgi:hypothetical protein
MSAGKSRDASGLVKKAAKTQDRRWREIRSAIAKYPILDLLYSFFASGLFFMLVGGLFLWISYATVERTHAAMTFVFVVVGVAILLYGTGTQGIGSFDSGKSAVHIARYKVALAGGAGITAFCVAAGIIVYHEDMKKAFSVEQHYIRFYLSGTGGYQTSDIGLYIPDIRVNGNPTPAVRQGDHIVIYAPYVMNADSALFEIQANLYLIDKVGGLNQRPRNDYQVVLKSGGVMVDRGRDGGTFKIDSGYDFPRYTLMDAIDIKDRTPDRIGGENIK